MPDIPPEVYAAADAALDQLPQPENRFERDRWRIASHIALEAAAPLLAEAWGVSGTAKSRRPGSTRDPRARVHCRRCGAQPGQQCVTSSGTRAPMVHAERRNDSRRAEGQTTGLEQEGANVDRFPPPAPRGMSGHA